MAMTGAQIGGNYSSQGGPAVNAAPRTIASAIGRVEGLNERLVEVRQQLSKISDVIGGPRPESDPNKSAGIGSGIVYRLNDAADESHMAVTDIESLLASIQRSLG
jgi:hypothetical protein